LKLSDDSLAGFPIHARKSSRGVPSPESGSRKDASGGDPSEGRADEGEGSPASGSKRGLSQVLLQFLEEIVGSADGLVEVYADRIRLSIRRTVVQTAIGVGVAVCTAICLGAAVLAVLRGTCGGLTALWNGREWLGDLTGGLLVCTLAAGAIVCYLRLSSRRELRRLKAKYEQIRNGHNDEQDAASPASDGGGVA
jgi:hypothetical protein